MNQTNVKRDVYQIVTDRIIELLEKGTVPWNQPWTNAGLPQNLISHKPYRGMNVLLLTSLNYEQNFFLTFKQVKELEATIRKGEKGHIVVFWKRIETEDLDTREKTVKPFLRYYTVFNVAQIDGIPPTLIPASELRINDPIEACENVIRKMPLRPPIQHIDRKAYYHPTLDLINMPEMKSFIDSEGYYSVLLHELIHSTGHSSRLKRKELTQMAPFGSEPYSIEELTAEIGASYLISLTGIVSLQRPFENNAAYIQGWLKKLRNDRKFIVYASAQAQRAVDFILNIIPETTIESTTEV